MKDIDKDRIYLTERFGEENAPTEYRTIAGRSLCIDDGKTEVDWEYSSDGQFQRIISYKQEKKRPNLKL